MDETQDKMQHVHLDTTAQDTHTQDATPKQPRDKEAKKAAKAAEKAKKEAEKRQRQKEREELERLKTQGPDVKTLTLQNIDEEPIGYLNIGSEATTGRSWATIQGLAPSQADETLWLRGRIHNSRKQSNKLTFLEIRQNISTVQAVAEGKEMAAFVGALPRESVVDVHCKLSVPPAPIKSCTNQGVELQILRAYCVSRAASEIPFGPEEAGRSKAEVAELGVPSISMPTRLDNRILDLRTAANQGIMRIQSAVSSLFREQLLKRDFIEIHSPKMIATASEGGAEVFRLDYFEGSAYLAQSPQLYKQMALMGDMGRVFEIGPVFRAEKSFTHRHMTEFVGLDLEMTFMESYHEVLDVIEEVFLSIFDGLNQRCRAEIEAVRRQYPFEDLRYSRPALRLTFAEAIALLREHGPGVAAEKVAELEAEQAECRAKGHDERAQELVQIIDDAKAHAAGIPVHADDEDLSTKDERILGVVVGRVKGVDFYTVDKFPLALRPFYTMPDPKDPKWSNSYDLFIRGEEVTSGAQRCHNPDMLLENAERLGVDMEPIKDYVESFKYGAFPHAGGGIGLERVVMLFLQLDNIRKSSLFPRDPARLTP